MSESQDKIIVARKYETADEYLARKKKEETERKKQQALLRKQNRNSRSAQSAPYTKPPPKTKSLTKDEELALAGLIELQNKREISDVKQLLDITPSKPVPILSESTFIYTPSELDRSIMREEFKRSQPSALNFNEEIDMGFDLDEAVNEKGGRKKRRKSRKLRKSSSKKSRKSRRKMTRKHRHRRH